MSNNRFSYRNIALAVLIRSQFGNDGLPVGMKCCQRSVAVLLQIRSLQPRLKSEYLKKISFPKPCIRSSLNAFKIVYKCNCCNLILDKIV